MFITVRIRSVYGVVTVYPVCDKALAFAAIAGKRTLTQAALIEIGRLGFEVRVEAPTLSVNQSIVAGLRK